MPVWQGARCGIVLAVAFLVAGRGLTVNKTTNKIEPRTTTTATPTPRPARRRPGAAPPGTLYRLADCRLVVVEADGKTRPLAP